MDSSNIDYPQIDQISIDNYIVNTKSLDLTIQIVAVRNFISHIWTKTDSMCDQIFIQHYPNDLHQQFILMSDCGPIVDRYHELKTIFIDVFIFIFRKPNYHIDWLTQSIVLLFLSFIKTSRDHSEIVQITFFDSINNCISNKTNRILFINENGMFYLCLFFNIENVDLATMYWNMCNRVYKQDFENKYLSHTKLTDCVNIIMSEFEVNRAIFSAKILFMVLRMIHRSRILDQVIFDVNEFHEITASILSYYLNLNHGPMIIVSLSKIWTGILNGSHQNFQIDNIDKLMTLCAIFSIDLSHKLRTAYQGRGTFHFTKNKKMKLYIIHLTILAYDMIDHTFYPWFKDVLMVLHVSFQRYFENYSTNDLSIEDQLHFFQYYIKSYSITSLPLSYLDDQAIKNFLQKIVTNPLLSNIF
ncbi:hypothetical protein RF11_14494 [Thelohanellus kitauei]|uniref:Uncharacterized protein n=1 Tax=Thelohanellus kitauei TaxID=669202 RepID=A0A0C2MZX3_THEKT|nr:hypothetical protein RF11_14494 [Thelohanellus kitauei]